MSCEPYVCPGTYAPADTPIEVLRDLRDKACNVLTPMDRQLLQDFGAYQVHKPIALPTSLPADQRERLLECMKLRAEYDTRYHSGAIGYRPWTADFLCDPQMNPVLSMELEAVVVVGRAGDRVGAPQPTLITMSGKSANFLAGGEFPIPVPQPSGVGTTITIEYKPFGVGLNFTPTVLSSKKISMQVAPEVSDLDFSNAIQISGFVVPAITTRRVSTTVELPDGQSFAIAGLLTDNVREVVSKFPLLGDIPILGVLFRSTSFQKNETELIIIVTPHLVKPMNMAKQTLPTDQYIEPDDFEFYLLGALEGRKKENRTPGPSSSPDARKGMKLG